MKLPSLTASQSLLRSHTIYLQAETAPGLRPASAGLLKFFHVTKKDKLNSIKAKGLVPSSGMSAGGMSADSSEAYKYAEQDKGLVYLWTEEDYTDRFKKDGVQYAMLIVNAPDSFSAEHIRPPKQPFGTPITGTTAVCDATIPLSMLSYKKTASGPEIPFSEYGKFSMALDKADTEIWGGLED